jgi:hypothetical protein
MADYLVGKLDLVLVVGKDDLLVVRTVGKSVHQKAEQLVLSMVSWSVGQMVGL